MCASVRGHGRVHLPCPAEDAAVEVVQAGEAVRREGVARGGKSLWAKVKVLKTTDGKIARIGKRLKSWWRRREPQRDAGARSASRAC